MSKMQDLAKLIVEEKRGNKSAAKLLAEEIYEHMTVIERDHYRRSDWSMIIVSQLMHAEGHEESSCDVLNILDALIHGE